MFRTILIIDTHGGWVEVEENYVTNGRKTLVQNVRSFSMSDFPLNIKRGDGWWEGVGGWKCCSLVTLKKNLIRNIGGIFKLCDKLL